MPLTSWNAAVGDRTTAGLDPHRSRRSTWAGDVLGSGLDVLLRRRLRGVWVRGELPDGPVVWAANHHSWWDPFVAHAVLSHAERPAGLLMDPVNLQAFSFLRHLGVVPTPRAALTALRKDRVLVIFPEGELFPPGPLRPIRPGAGWLAARGPALLVAAAVRVVMRGHEAPEAYVDLQLVEDPGCLAARLSADVEALDALLVSGDPRHPPVGFRRVVRGRVSWDERLQDPFGRRIRR